MFKKIELPDYTLIDSNFFEEEGNWLQYNHKKKQHSDATKVHISISHDIPTVQKAQELILPILASHNISCFKTINTNNFSSHINLDGKEFCIYMQTWDTDSNESKPEFWINLFKEIEINLEKHGIAHHPNGALGDLLFPGSKGYIYYRNPNNISEDYVGAVVLMESGFTRKEACDISKNEFFHDYFFKVTNPPQASSHRVLPNLLEADDQLKQSILYSLSAQLVNNDKLLKLFAGSESGSYCSHTSLCDELFGTNFGYYKRYVVFEKAQLGQFNLIKPFKKYLDSAAEKLAKITSILEKNGFCLNTKNLGSILPALYFNFYIPLHLRNITSPPGQSLELNDADSEQLVNEIVRCSLRDTTKTPIHFDLPQYINNMNEQDISMLLECVEEKKQVMTELKKETLPTSTAGNNPKAQEVVIEKEQINPSQLHVSNESSAPKPTMNKSVPMPEQNSQQSNFNRQSDDLDKILDQYAADIELIGTHHVNAKHTAEELLKNLRQYKIEAFKEPTTQTLKQFAQKTKTSIQRAIPDLQKDLGWGDYLLNLTKQILNGITSTIAYIVTLGSSSHHGFFDYKLSQIAHQAQDLDNSLNLVISF